MPCSARTIRSPSAPAAPCRRPTTSFSRQPPDYDSQRRATLNSQNFTFAVPGTISGTGTLTIAGGTSGVVALSGNNTYGGGTYINSGELGLYSNTAIPSGGTIAFGGGALQFTASNNNSPTDYSGSIFNSTGEIAIDTNGQNVTFGRAL